MWVCVPRRMHCPFEMTYHFHGTCGLEARVLFILFWNWKNKPIFLQILDFYQIAVMFLVETG
jgi:hypothetical protein